MKKTSIVLLSLLLASSCSGRNDVPLFMEKYMKENDLTGAVIVESLSDGKKYIYNKKRTEARYLPASTFKIVNTLIALQEGAVTSEIEYIKWDGSDKGFTEWNKDQNVMSAFPSSCVWFYQELARRIGNERYLFYLKALHYGNGETGKKIDTFWLDGDLAISVNEQIEVLKNIYLEKYQFKKRNYDVLKKAMIVDKSDSYVVRAKTGWTMRVTPQIGWCVGYIETKDGVWFFACNIDIRKTEDAAHRERIAYRAFEEIGILK